MKIYKDIPGSSEWNMVKEINKGWSSDKKYYIKGEDGQELLLRISDISQYENKLKEFQAVKQLEHTDILMSRPIDFGVCNKGEEVFTLLTWTTGEDAEIVIPTLSDKQQYEMGVKAGKALRQIHELPAPKNQISWAEHFNHKIDKKIAGYKACGIHLRGADKIINYIEENRHLLENRPQRFQHGDYHVGNMIITKSGELGIIDFNRFDYGDPWEEFNRITWCVSKSELFASGYINSYFNYKVPDLFFKLMALYIANNQLSSIPWAIPFGQEEVNIMIKQGEDILKWYDEFETYIPNWYRANFIE